MIEPHTTQDLRETSPSATERHPHPPTEATRRSSAARAARNRMLTGIVASGIALLLALNVTDLHSADSARADTPQGQILVLPAALVTPSGPEVLTLHGRIVVPDRRLLSFEAGGTISRLTVERGDEVEAGHVIARLDERSLRHSRRALDARADELQAMRDHAATDLERTRRLVASGAATPRQQESLEASIAQAEAGLRGIAAEREELERRTREAVLRTPVGGVVREVHVREGMVVGPGSPVAELQAGGTMEAEVAVPESWLLLVQAGMAAEVHLPTLPPRVIEARVDSVLEAGPGRLSRARFVLEGEQGLRPGLRVEVHLVRDVAGVEVPLAALIRTPEPSVWVVEGGVVRRVGVELEAVRGQMARARGALEPGMAVLVGGLEQVREGAAVQTTDAAQAERSADAAGEGDGGAQ